MRMGKFEIVGELGRGGMGVVLEARDTVLERQVAIKLLPQSVSARPEALERFLREARAAARLNHPHVVTVCDADQFDGQYYIVLELVRGGSLQDSLTNGPLPWFMATRVLADACGGLDVAHRAGLVHRDIKPSNLMQSEDGTVKLTDFGLARSNDSTDATMTGSGSVLGSASVRSSDSGFGLSVRGRFAGRGLRKVHLAVGLSHQSPSVSLGASSGECDECFVLAERSPCLLRGRDDGANH